MIVLQILISILCFGGAFGMFIFGIEIIKSTIDEISCRGFEFGDLLIFSLTTASFAICGLVVAIGVSVYFISLSNGRQRSVCSE